MPCRHSWGSPGCGSRIENIVERREVALDVSDLLPCEQEAMCTEFLRLERAEQLGLPRLRHLLVRVGGTMRDLDFLGVDMDGRKMAAQVTFKDIASSQEKLKCLMDYRTKEEPHPHLLFFCSAEHIETKDGVTTVPLSTVFNEFTKVDAGKAWVEALRPKFK